MRQQRRQRQQQAPSSARPEIPQQHRRTTRKRAIRPMANTAFRALRRNLARHRQHLSRRHLSSSDRRDLEISLATLCQELRAHNAMRARMATVLMG